jgi:glycine cleavage system H lipoate-binding protein
MVAIFVVLTILGFLMVDYLVQKFQARRAKSNAGQADQVHVDEKFAPILSADSIAVPSSLFFHRGHTWIRFTSPNHARIGLDDFAQKVLGQIEGIQFPRIGETLRQGDPLFMVKVGQHKLFLPAPSDGVVTHLNTELATDPSSLHSNPYEAGWVCEMKPENISKNIRELLSGEDAVRWELHELNKLQYFLNERTNDHAAPSAREFSLGRSWSDESDRPVMNEFSKSFFALDMDRTEPQPEVS